MSQPQPAPHGVAAWLDLMRTTDALLLAGLRHKIGPEGDLQAAYREWYAQHMREHDVGLANMVRGLREGGRRARDAG